MKTVTSHKVESGLRWLLALLMLWAAVSKLANPTEFLGSIYGYQLPLPRPVLLTAAVVLPWVELLCGLLLLAGFWSQTALLSVTGLLAIFVIATGQAWARGLDISCGCFNLKIFGLSERLPGLVRFLESVSFAFFRNLLLVGLAGFLLRQSLRSPPAVRAIVGE
jgi:putative oxidoreductase